MARDLGRLFSRESLTIYVKASGFYFVKIRH